MFDPFNLTVDVVLSLVIIFGLLTTMAYMTWFERRVISKLQARIGPNTVGWQGLMQPLADALKLFFKEDIRPVQADRLLYVIAPAISLFAALIAFAVIPIGPSIWIAGVEIPLQVSDLPVGVIYLLAASSLGVYGLVLGGWGSGSKYSLLGALRAAAHCQRHAIARRHRRRAGELVVVRADAARRLRPLHDRRRGRDEPGTVRSSGG
jgi:NADH-quinone oxidoreductase subunit H